MECHTALSIVLDALHSVILFDYHHNSDSISTVIVILQIRKQRLGMSKYFVKVSQPASGRIFETPSMSDSKVHAF